MATVYADPDVRLVETTDPESEANSLNEGSLVGYVKDKAQEWEDYYTSNYKQMWDEFARIWRGRWSEEDKVRDTERSRIITPATQQAVESSVCEIEEATFGHGKYFDIRDDSRDEESEDIVQLRKYLDEAFRKNKVRAACSEVLINAAVYGTGIAEVVVTSKDVQTLAEQPALEGQLTAFGVQTTPTVTVTMKPVMPRNFRIDPVATSIEDAHGCVIDEFVPMHTVLALQANGTYLPGNVGDAPADLDIEPDPMLNTFAQHDKVRLQKYFGLVPKHLLEQAQGKPEDEDEDSLEKTLEEPKPRNQTELVEAVVIIANGETLLKAEESPYMMKDRPVVAFQWDIVPGLFWGRGVVEKGYNSQKALDAEIRARIDALALTIHPMLAFDATRIPRGHKPQVKAGARLLTNGNPKEIINPFNFGDVSNITFSQAAELQKMVQQSTGAVDASGLPGTVNGEATAAGVSMSLGAIIKRQKRTLVNFQECFWIPFVEKAAWRYMQFDPDRFTIQDYDFVPCSTLGIMAREYEVTQLVQLLQTMSPDSPMYPALVQSIVDNMNINDREKLLKILDEAAKPDPEEQQRMQEAHALEMRHKKGLGDYVVAQANESNARAENYRADAAERPRETEIKKIEAITRNLDLGSQDDQEFDRRMRVAELALKEIDIRNRGLAAKNKGESN